MKICSKCKQENAISEFCKDRQKRDGLSSSCLDCRRPVCAAWEKGHPTRHRKWQKANGDKCRAATAKWRKANLEVARANGRALERANPKRHEKWNAANEDKVKAYDKKWKDANPAKCRAHTAKRRAAKKQAMPIWANKEAILAKYEEAQQLSRTTGTKYHVDHQVPLQHPLVCGLHVEHNLEAITAKQNCTKRNKFWPDMPA